VTTVVELVVESPVQPWIDLGLAVADHDGRHVATVGSIAVRFVPGDRGLVAWGLADCPNGVDSIDGLATHHLEPGVAGDAGGALGVVGWDHVVVMTSSLDRTCAAIEAATGATLKRIREAGPIRQGFHRLGELIVEVVETDRHTLPTASFWGFVWNVADLEGVCDRLGPDVVTPPKDAVQRGRRIASVRAAAGLCVPLALMTPA
jgi:hypothetical protein